MIVVDDFRTSEVEEPSPNVALMLIGGALAEALRDTTDLPLPEPLVRLVQEIEQRVAEDREDG